MQKYIVSLFAAVLGFGLLTIISWKPRTVCPAANEADFFSSIGKVSVTCIEVSHRSNSLPVGAKSVRFPADAKFDILNEFTRLRHKHYTRGMWGIANKGEGTFYYGAFVHSCTPAAVSRKALCPHPHRYI
jgi:hypothetical protein